MHTKKFKSTHHNILHRLKTVEDKDFKQNIVRKLFFIVSVFIIICIQEFCKQYQACPQSQEAGLHFKILSIVGCPIFFISIFGTMLFIM